MKKINGALFHKSGNERPFIGDRAIGAGGERKRIDVLVSGDWMSLAGSHPAIDC